jgi:DUF4097 and DUF4098 domain-containing protein YvlB
MGQITVGRLTGSAQIRNGQGDVTITEAVAGAVELRTDLGNVSIGASHGVSATLDARTSRGHISNTLRNTAGAGAALSIKATTLSGDIVARSR